MPNILTLNGGSSSIKFAIYDCAQSLHRKLEGQVDRIGPAGSGSAVTQLLDSLERQPDFASVIAIGLRVVHGMRHVVPTLVTPALVDELHRISALDPQHMPDTLELSEMLRTRYPNLPQIACFDTAFHSTLPRVARLLPIPHRLDAAGVQRFGFHGLSYAFLMEELARLRDPAAVRGRVILAHLGSGASLAAVRDGQSVDTSMGFTPAAGMPMSTRSGDIDPGLPDFLARSEKMSAAQFQHMVNHESGLLGVSGTSSDMRDLLAREATDVRAAEAVALFCYQAKKWIGAFAAVLGGLDTLVFTAGVGEHAHAVRLRICDGLEFLGVEIDAARNAQGAPVISADASRVRVRVLHTDEALMIARAVQRHLAANPELVMSNGGAA